MQPSLALVAGPVAGLATTAGVGLSRAYWAKWEANDRYYELRDNYFEADRKQVVKAAKRAREAAQAASAAAAAAWHQSDEAALMRAGRAQFIEAGLLVG